MDRRESFIRKSRAKHGNKYDYSKVVYVDSLTKVIIVCPKHGEFLQTPQAHARGNGCPKCANIKRGDTFRSDGDTFIKKATKIHNGKYIYDKDRYVNAMTKIPILCMEHGTFWMTPMNHLLGQGCPKCSGRGLSTEEVIERFKEVHGNKYDYSKFNFTKMHDKACIICSEHGEFMQTPSKHLLGQGCPKCGIIKKAKSKKLTTNEFIEKAIKVHGDKYDYSKTLYNGTYDELTIICPIHGEFKQKANDHLNGHGCPMCSESSLEREIKVLLEEHNIEFESQKRFDWLDKQSLDFYIPNINIAIECQGGQHFQPIEHFGGEKEFKVIKERDERKNKLCSDNGIKILYYSNIENQNCITNKEELLAKILAS